MTTITVQTEVDVCINEIDTDDLIEELQRRRAHGNPRKGEIDNAIDGVVDPPERFREIFESMARGEDITERLAALAWDLYGINALPPVRRRA
jgi:hypothetical protein